jgi:sec-independent protein translocase protein TatC
MTQPAPEEQPRGEMPFLDHLEELRWRLLKSVIAIAVGVVAGYAIVTHFDMVAILKHPMDKHMAPGQKLLFMSLMDPFVLQLKIAIAIGGSLALPVILYQAWAFLRPALYHKEARIVFPMLFASVILFAGGVSVGFFVVMPLAIPVMLGFATASMAPILTANEYFGFTLAVVLAFGAVFEVPLIMFLLIYMRIVSSAFLRRHHRTFIIINTLASSILTPGDLIVMTLIVMVPIQLFYELGILMAIVMERRRRKAEAAAAEHDHDGVPAAV